MVEIRPNAVRRRSPKLLGVALLAVVILVPSALGFGTKLLKFVKAASGSGEGGFAILPLSGLGRPRIDVTLRISGMFRDAFPEQIDLLDSAIRAVAALDEPEDANPIAAAVRAAAARLAAAGFDEGLAARQAGARIFGCKPGAYGAGSLATAEHGRLWLDAAIAEKAAHVREIHEQQRRREKRREAGYGLWGK